MISGITFPMQSHVPNLRITLQYEDGQTHVHELVNPFDIGDCWGTHFDRIHDTAANGFENLGGRSGPSGSADVKDLTQPIPLDTEAHLVALPLRGAPLGSFTVAIVANDAIFGVMGATLEK